MHRYASKTDHVAEIRKCLVGLCKLLFQCKTMTITFEECPPIVKVMILINQTKSTQCVFKPCLGTKECQLKQ